MLEAIPFGEHAGGCTQSFWRMRRTRKSGRSDSRKTRVGNRIHAAFFAFPRFFADYKLHREWCVENRRWKKLLSRDRDGITGVLTDDYRKAGILCDDYSSLLGYSKEIPVFCAPHPKTRGAAYRGELPVSFARSKPRGQNASSCLLGLPEQSSARAVALYSNLFLLSLVDLPQLEADGCNVARACPRNERPFPRPAPETSPGSVHSGFAPRDSTKLLLWLRLVSQTSTPLVPLHLRA